MDNIIINIDSRFRNKQIYNNSGKFIYQLSEKIKNCKYIRLSSFEFPNLYFTFTEKKNNISKYWKNWPSTKVQRIKSSKKIIFGIIKKIIVVLKGAPSYTFGDQKWNGAIVNLKKKVIVIRKQEKTINEL